MISLNNKAQLVPGLDLEAARKNRERITREQGQPEPRKKPRCSKAARGRNEEKNALDEGKLQEVLPLCRMC